MRSHGPMIAIGAPWTARLTSVALLGLLLLTLTPISASAHPIDADWEPPGTVYIPATGQTIDGLFLDLWRGSGAADSFGNPITPEIDEADGRIVQYYEYARFEYWPKGNADGAFVAVGKIGADLRLPLVRRSAPAADRTARSYRAAPGTAAQALAAVLAWLPVADDAAPAEAPDWRFVPETKHGVWGVFRSFWEATGEDAYLGDPLTEEYAVDGVTYQIFERGQLAWEPGMDPWMVPVGTLLAERFGLDTAPSAQGDVPTYDEQLFVAPAAIPALSLAPAPVPGAARSIVVSIGQQALWAYEGDRIVLSTYVSTGKERFDTPTGTFFINNKLPVQDMAGVIGGESYNVPRVPDVMYFTDRGHAIHGTYWHDNFGTPMSHGCINLPMDVSNWLYDWTSIGTPVLIVP